MHPKPETPIYLDTHSMPATKAWVPNLEGWEPVYLDGVGNGTLIYQADGSHFYTCFGSNRVFRTVAGFYAIDVEEMRRHFNTATRRSQSVPLAIAARKLCLFSFKARTPRYRNDGATGYIADQCILDVEKVTPRTAPVTGVRITLQSGAEILAPMPIDLFEDHRNVASYFHFYLRTNQII